MTEDPRRRSRADQDSSSSSRYDRRSRSPNRFSRDTQQARSRSPIEAGNDKTRSSYDGEKQSNGNDKAASAAAAAAAAAAKINAMLEAKKAKGEIVSAPTTAVCQL